MIKDKIQQKVGKALDNQLVGVPVNFSCTKEIQSGDYDYETQTYPVITTKVYEGRGVLGNYLKDVVKPSDYQVEDGKLLVLQNEVSAVPQIDDVINIDGGLFRVINIGKDPANATYKIQIRTV